MSDNKQSDEEHLAEMDRRMKARTALRRALTDGIHQCFEAGGFYHDVLTELQHVSGRVKLGRDEMVLDVERDKWKREQEEKGK